MHEAHVLMEIYPQNFFTAKMQKRCATRGARYFITRTKQKSRVKRCILSTQSIKVPTHREQCFSASRMRWRRPLLEFIQVTLLPRCVEGLFQRLEVWVRHVFKLTEITHLEVLLFHDNTTFTNMKDKFQARVAVLSVRNNWILCKKSLLDVVSQGQEFFGRCSPN